MTILQVDGNLVVLFNRLVNKVVILFYRESTTD